MFSGMRIAGAVCGLMLLSACGGGQFSNANTVTSAASRAGPTVLFAKGPISRACEEAGRKGASRARCGCVQAVANRTLSASDQRRGARFFSDPHQAQVVRQADGASNEAFWKRWRAYGDQAAALCA